MTPLFIIQQTGDLYSVRSIALDTDPHRRLTDLRPGRFALQGQAAAILYAALSSHRFGTSPATARPEIAYHYRAHLQRWAHLYTDWLLAARVVAHFGPWYQPWLGLLKVDANGQPIRHDPDYDRRSRL